jgi:hypothetical protein
MSAGDAGFRWAAKARASVAICLAGAVAGVGLYAGNDAFIQEITQAVPACLSACVTDGSYVFNPAMASVERDIAAEDAQVRAERTPYVSVALLEPFTYTASGGVPLGQMVDEMRGAYLAQRAVNAQPSFGVQLLLANEGTGDEEFSVQAVRQLESLESPDHLVAVTGMGIDVAGTAEAARELAADQMPMFGTATGDGFNSQQFPGFDQVIPALGAQVSALMAILRARPGALSRSPVLVTGQVSDSRVNDLQADILHDLGRFQNMYPISSVQSAASVQSALIAESVCSAKTPPSVFYAGRAEVLTALILRFQITPECAGEKITIITADDADSLNPSATLTSGSGAQVSVVYTGIANPSELTSAFVTSYKRYLATADPGSAGLSDAWTIATYNAMMAAGDAITDLTTARGDTGTPTKPAVEALTGLLRGIFAPQGATGPFSLGPNGQLLNPSIPVFEDADGTRTLVRI